jgi:curli biogenesis system outer membrane secretion channel CsgG
MKKSSILFLTSIAIIMFLTFNYSTAQVIPPKARGTPSQGPTIEQAQKEDAMGPKARVAVTRFQDKSGKGYKKGNIGDGMAEMLANALFSTNRFIVLERQSLDDVMKEQDLGASGRVRQETAARIGEIEGADLLIEGTITEFEPGTAGAGGAAGGVIPLPGPGGRVVRGIGGVAGGIKTSHVAMIVKVIDARTGRRLASEQVEGKATDIGGITGMGGGGLAGVFSGYSKTPMEKAIRVAIEESVRLIVAKTPPEYYRVGAIPPPQAPPPTTTAAPTPVPSVSPPPIQPPLKTPGPKPRIVYVKWPTVSLREGPGMNFKTLVEIKKGTTLAVLEEKGQWLRVSLEDGREGWIGRATTSDIP